MVFDRLKNVAEQAKTVTGDLGQVALEKITQSQRELNEALPIFKAVGLSIHTFGVDMTVPPAVRMRLVGAVESIEPTKLHGVIDTHKDKKILVMVLEALRTASFMKDQLGDVGLRGVTADVLLALPPSVKVDFLRNALPVDG